MDLRLRLSSLNLAAVISINIMEEKQDQRMLVC